MKKVVILLASGSSKRLGLKTPKQYQIIKNKYLLEYSLETFCRHEEVDSVLLVVSRDYKKEMKKNLLDKYQKLEDIIVGGKERYDSVYEGLSYYQDKYQNKEKIKLLIHDSARALVNEKIITSSLKKLDSYRAMTTVIPLNDTIVIGDDNVIHRSVIRDHYRACQTPQGFYLDEIFRAYSEFINKPNKLATDDTSIYLSYFSRNIVGSVMGNSRNFKITNKEHLSIFKEIIDNV